MARRPAIPVQLTRGPFTVEEARQAGLTRRQLESRCWRRLGPGTYVWAGLPYGPAQILAAIQRRLPIPAVFSGRTAAWLHGLEFDPCDPVSITVPAGCGVSGRVGIAVRRAAIAPGETAVRQGVRVTSVLRTLADLAQELPLVEAVVAVDSALRLQLASVTDLTRWTAEHAGVKGVKRMRQVVELAEPATESQMETRLRLLLILGGLPRPKVQVNLHDAQGEFVARADLYYPQRRLAIEYDGATHRESLLEDNRRQNRLLGAGYRLLRFASGDVLRAPGSVISEVRGALTRAA